MAFYFETPTPLAYFAKLVQSDKHFPLLEAAASLAQDEYPLLDIEQVLADADQLLDRLLRRIPADAPAIQKLRILNQFFFKDMCFGGNVNDYYDPDNSYVNVILRNRRGIPISLAVVWLELAQSIGLQAQGVGFPGHFMLKVHLTKGQVVIDPFTGQSLSREELADRLQPYLHATSEMTDIDIHLNKYLKAAEPRHIIERMLRNLKEIHKSQEDWDLLIAVLNRLIILLPQAWLEYRDRGLAYAETGRPELALNDLQKYLDKTNQGPHRDAINRRVLELRRSLQ
jgi:regulator of sirC expression with transglutaminase-like and TPR domain